MLAPTTAIVWPGAILARSSAISSTVRKALRWM